MTAEKESIDYSNEMYLKFGHMLNPDNACYQVGHEISQQYLAEKNLDMFRDCNPMDSENFKMDIGDFLETKFLTSGFVVDGLYVDSSLSPERKELLEFMFEKENFGSIENYAFGFFLFEDKIFSIGFCEINKPREDTRCFMVPIMKDTVSEEHRSGLLILLVKVLTKSMVAKVCIEAMIADLITKPEDEGLSR